MDHEAYENEMIDSVNRHADEKDLYADAFESTVTTKKSVFAKTDAKALKLGLKRTLLAIFTALLFALAVFCFILVATAKGYWAVMLFFAALAFMGCGYIFLYAQGITNAGSKGDNK
jgi:hypothetical protein